MGIMSTPASQSPSSASGTDRRTEARSHSTAPDRLRELTRLDGDRGHIDADAGWCREYVAANPSAPEDVLAELGADMNDVMCRRNVAENPSAPQATLQRLADDTDELTSDAARRRLGLTPRVRAGIPIMGGHRLDPRNGRITR